MHLDVGDLRDFYYRRALGRAVQTALREQVLRIWPDARSQYVLGFGFAPPLLRPFMEDAERVIALMPGEQGVMPWPSKGPNIAVLCEETLWPVQNGEVDRLLLLHGLETSEHPTALLNECYRVLKPQGRALFIVPNRGGLWARRDATPFGFGRPYSLGQLEAQLKRHDFMPEQHCAALFQPPSDRRFWRKAGPIWEKAGRSLSNALAGGVLIVEVIKQERAPLQRGEPETVRRPLRALEGLAQPGPAPARRDPRPSRPVAARTRDARPPSAYPDPARALNSGA